MSTEETLAPLAAKLAQVQHDLELLRQEESDLKAAIREAVHDETDTYAAGGLAVQVSVNRRFDERAALAAVPAELVDRVTESTRKVNRQKLEVLAPEAYECGWIVGAPRVQLR